MPIRQVSPHLCQHVRCLLTYSTINDCDDLDDHDDIFRCTKNLAHQKCCHGIIIIIVFVDIIIISVSNTPDLLGQTAALTGRIEANCLPME